jgi:hypothetical protein
MLLVEAHHVLGHISYSAVKHAIKSGQISGIQINENSNEVFCDACMKAKPHCKPFPDQAKNHAENFGKRIHADLWGPVSIQSLRKALYSLDFTNDAKRWAEIRFLQTKDQTQGEYEKFEKGLETVDKVCIGIFRSNRGTKFKNTKFDEHLARQGMKQELTVHDTHEQVGVAEQLN